MSTGAQSKSLSFTGWRGISNQFDAQLCYFIQENSPFTVRNQAFSRISYKRYKSTIKRINYDYKMSTL